MNKDDLIPNYTKVHLKHNHVITGFTSGISISGRQMDIIEYRFVYWAGMDRKEEWVSRDEIEPIPTKEPTGFRKQENQLTTL